MSADLFRIGVGAWGGGHGGGGGLNVSKFTSEPILFEKFSKPRSDDPFFIPFCFLFKYLLSNILRYSWVNH